jgi:hypothetical protein
MSTEWRQQAAAHVESHPEAWVTILWDRNDLALLRAEELSDEMLAEMARELAGAHFASPDDRIAVIERASDMTLGPCRSPRRSCCTAPSATADPPGRPGCGSPTDTPPRSQHSLTPSSAWRAVHRPDGPVGTGTTTTMASLRAA